MAGVETGYFKPVQTGADSDCGTVEALTQISHAEIEEPTYSFPEPMAPYLAAKRYGRTISLPHIDQRWSELSRRAWIVEGAGGLLVPLNAKETIRDLISMLNLPLVLVASTRLGTINHTLLSLETAAKAGLRVLGVVLVGPHDANLKPLFEQFAGASVVAEIPWLSDVSPNALGTAAGEYFPRPKLAQLFPELFPWPSMRRRSCGATARPFGTLTPSMVCIPFVRRRSLPLGRISSSAMGPRSWMRFHRGG